MQPRRDGKIMTSKRRKPPNRRSCFLFRIEGSGKLSHLRQPSVSHDAISAELDDRLTARTEFQCKGILINHSARHYRASIYGCSHLVEYISNIDWISAIAGSAPDRQRRGGNGTVPCLQSPCARSFLRGDFSAAAYYSVDHQKCCPRGDCRTEHQIPRGRHGVACRGDQRRCDQRRRTAGKADAEIVRHGIGAQAKFAAELLGQCSGLGGHDERQQKRESS